MHTINLQVEVEDTLYEDIKKQGIDLQAQFKEFLLDLRDDGYPAISTEEAKKRVGEAVEDYHKNGIKNCKVLNDKFWDDTEKRLLERHKQVS